MSCVIPLPWDSPGSRLWNAIPLRNSLRCATRCETPGVCHEKPTQESRMVTRIMELWMLWGGLTISIPRLQVGSKIQFVWIDHVITSGASFTSGISDETNPGKRTKNIPASEHATIFWPFSCRFGRSYPQDVKLHRVLTCLGLLWPFKLYPVSTRYSSTSWDVNPLPVTRWQVMV